MKHFFIFLIFLISIQLRAQVDRNSTLFLTLKKQDSLLFERAYNRCDMAYLESVTDKNLEFTLDKKAPQNRAAFFDDVKKNFCNEPNKKMIRKVDPKSIEVFALYKDGALYGAVQSGSHDFYSREPGKPDRQTGTAKFTHIWLLEKGKWMLKEVMDFSYQGEMKK